MGGPSSSTHPEPPAAEPPAVPLGNALRFATGLPLVAVGSLVAVAAMALGARPSSPEAMPHRHPAAPMWVGLFGSLVAVVGLFELVGSFDDDAEPRARARGGPLARALGALGVAALGLFLALRLAVQGWLGPGAAAVAIPAAFLTLVVMVFRAGEALGPLRTDETGALRPLPWRHGFWLVVAATLVLLPRLGSHGLTDPWETHYGEVAREILARNDWISLWWAQDGWFWSKPILTFWMQALGMLALGVRYEPGQMLASAATGPEPWPEWAVRFPVFVFALLGTYVLYKAVARAFGRRAGLFAGLALTAMPQWFFVAHQTMTDLPFVAALAAAMGFAAMAITCDPSAEVARWEVLLLGRSLRVSAWHLVLGAVLALAVPQALYLLSRNVELLVSPLVLGARADTFWQGSGLGNCGLPGNVDCKAFSPTLPRLYPALQALLWMQAIGLVLYLEWGERRRQRLLFLAAWLCAALATMAKGPAGLVLPAAALLAWMVSARRLGDLSKLELTAGLLTVCAVALPWFLAMYARHGSGFVDRLLFHDMFKRAFSHVHDTNEGDDTSFRYYVWQLGYATFPLVGLVPAALAGLARARLTGARGHTLGLFGLWFVLSFCLFAFIGTKFHHYILPVVPAAAALVGVLLDELWRSAGARAGAPSDAPSHAPLGAVALAGAGLVLAVGRDLFAPRAGQPSQARLLHLFTYNYRRPWPTSLDVSFELQVATLAAVACTLALAVPRVRRVAVIATLGVGLAFAAWGLDRYFVATSPHWGQRELVVAYHRANAEQPGPLVSYQQNWKGENFYTGNAVPAFVTSGLRFQDYVADKRRRGTNTVYFLVEHGRLTGLRGELSRPKELVALVPPEANNKFTLARATFE